MNFIEAKEQRKIFIDWKKRVKLKIPELAIKYYTDKINGKKYDERIERTLGMVIDAISNPYYDINDSRGDRLCPDSILATRCMLEIQVEELFNYTNIEQP